MPYLKRHKRNPVTGFKLAAKELFALHWHKNTDGQYVCPVLHKVFTENSLIVVIKTSGHVYSKEAVVKLNLNTKDLHCLVSGEAFSKKDVITLQDPNRTVVTIDNFAHVAAANSDTKQDLSSAVGMKRVFGEVLTRARTPGGPPRC